MRALLLAMGATLAALAAEPAAAASLSEIGDAGDLPSTAQSSQGVAPFGTPLDAITGTIASAFDQDMFEIYIDGPSSFSASTNNPGTNLSGDNDTMLFLFDSDGRGLLGNDDANFAVGLSTISAGSLTGPSGSYFIAISLFINTPVSPGGEIFDLDELVTNIGATVGPNGPGGGSPITAWDLFPDPIQTGPYRIDLTGATFVPEPSTTLLLLVAACIGLAARRRRPVAA